VWAVVAAHTINASTIRTAGFIAAFMMSCATPIVAPAIPS